MSSVKTTRLPSNYLWTSKLDQSDLVKSLFLCSVSGCRLFLWSVSSEAAVTSSSCPSSPAESSLFLFLSLLKQHQPTEYCRTFTQAHLQVFPSAAINRGFLQVPKFKSSVVSDELSRNWNVYYCKPEENSAWTELLKTGCVSGRNNEQRTCESSLVSTSSRVNNLLCLWHSVDSRCHNSSNPRLDFNMLFVSTDKCATVGLLDIHMWITGFMSWRTLL